MSIPRARGDAYDDAVAVSKPAGAIILDGAHVADTQQCCHCGRHFIVRRGSGRTRGWCLCCGKVTCGAPQCDACVPTERQLLIMEGRG